MERKSNWIAKFGLVALLIATAVYPVISATVSHLPSQLVPGSFQQGNYTFQNYTIALEGMCIGADCRASWPSGSGNAWNITTSTYLYNNSGILEVNETKLNATIDARGTGIWTNQSGTAFYPDDVKLDGTILLKNMSTPSADLSYAKLYYRTSQNVTNTSSIGGNDNYTVLLLHNDGDYSNQNHTYTVYGDPKLNASMPANDSTAFGGSTYFDGTGDYLTIPDHTDWDFGTGNFTIDMWFKKNGAQAYPDRLFERDIVNGVALYWTADQNLSFGAVNVYPAITSSNSISDTNWHHIAIVRDGITSTKMYLDGNQTGNTYTTNYNVVSAEALYVGAYSNGNNEYNGFIDEFRVSKGIARWTGNFTVPTAPYSNPDSDTKLLLHFDGDDSNSNHTITFYGNVTVNASAPANNTVNFSGSYDFDGTGDYLSTPDSDDWAFGSGNFTIDFWINFNELGEQYIVESWEASGGSNRSWHIRLASDNKIWAKGNNATQGVGFELWSANTVSAGVWYHIALVRINDLTRIYINGIEEAINYSSGDELEDSTVPLLIGANWQNGLGGVQNELNGSIDELRISKGIARWTGNFTPPNAPYDNSANGTTTTNTSKLYLLGPDGVETEIGGSSSSGSVSDSDWTISGSNVYHETGNVGIGVTSPGERLEVDGNINVTSGNDVCIEGGNCLSDDTNASLLYGYNASESEFRPVSITSGGALKMSIVEQSGLSGWVDDGTTIRLATTSDSVGIGTTTPTHELHVVGDANITGTVYAHNFSGNSDITFIDSGGSVSLTIQEDGDVGIGTTSPLAKAHIKTADAGVFSINTGADELLLEGSTLAGMTVLSGNTSIAQILFADKEDNDAGGIKYDHDVDDMIFRVNGSTKITVDSGGNVGIGTTSPEGSLHIAKSNNYGYFYFDNFDDGAGYSHIDLRKSDSDTIGTKATTDDSDNLGAIRFRGVDSGSNWDVGAYIIAQQDGAASTRVPTKLKLYTYSSTAANTDQLVLDSTGNVGIGTNSPGNKLVVNGDVNITGDYIYLGTASPGKNCYFKIRNDGNCPGNGESVVVDGSTYDICGYCP